MKIDGKKRLMDRAREQSRRSVECVKAVERWCTVVQGVTWRSFADVRQTFGTADQVGDKVIFNLRGNHYRLITIINYEKGYVYARHRLTHKEYDAGGWQ